MLELGGDRDFAFIPLGFKRGGMDGGIICHSHKRLNTAYLLRHTAHHAEDRLHHSYITLWYITNKPPSLSGTASLFMINHI